MNNGINQDFISNRNYNNFSFLLIFIYLFICINISSEHLRKLINLSSEIHLVINGNGNQNIINNTFYLEPSEVYVNGIYKHTCKKFCEMDNEINNVKLIFNKNIESCENMFYGSENITEIDFSNFDFF